MKILLCYSGGLDSTTLAFWGRHQKHEVTLASFDDGLTDEPLVSFEDTLWYQNWLASNYGFDKVVFRFPSLVLFKASQLKEGQGATAKEAEQTGSVFYSGLKVLMSTILLSHGSAFGYDEIWTGHMPFNMHYRDEDPKSFEAIEEVMRRCYGDRVTVPSIKHPLYDVAPTKEKVILLARQLEVPIGYTFSCDIPQGRAQTGRWLHCHKCVTCVERDQAFKNLGLKDEAL